MHRGSPKGKKRRGGLDVEAEECTEKVQKERSGVVDWTLKQREGTMKSKKEVKAGWIGRLCRGKARKSPKRKSKHEKTENSKNFKKV